MEYKYELFKHIFDSDIVNKVERFKSISTLLMNMSRYGISGHAFRDLTGAELMDKFLGSFGSPGYAIQKHGNKYDLCYLWGMDSMSGADMKEREANHKEMEAKTGVFFTFLKALDIHDFIYVTPLPLRKENPQAINGGEFGSVSRVKDIADRIEWFKSSSWMVEHTNMNNLRFFRIHKTSSNILLFYVGN